MSKPMLKGHDEKEVYAPLKMQWINGKCQVRGYAKHASTLHV
jgi:hypothetical protein